MADFDDEPSIETQCTSTVVHSYPAAYMDAANHTIHQHEYTPDCRTRMIDRVFE